MPAEARKPFPAPSRAATRGPTDGVCAGSHYDEHRYLATTGRDPEAQDKGRLGGRGRGRPPLRVRADVALAARDWLDVRYRARAPRGLGGPPGSANDGLLGAADTPRAASRCVVGVRGRPSSDGTKVDSYGDLGTTTRMNHEREVESLAWMARHGHLTGLELETLERPSGGGA